MNPRLLIISCAEEPGVEDRILRAGADIVVSPMQLGGQQIAEIIFGQSGDEINPAEDSQTASTLGIDLRLFKNNSEIETTVGAVMNDLHALSAVVLKHAGGETCVSPSPATVIPPGDSLIVLVKIGSESAGSIVEDREGDLILLADDHAALRKLFARKLRSVGHEVITARDGEEALRFAQEYCPDLIVLDVTMPGLSGYDVCARLKQKLAHRHTPVVLLSATEHHEFHERGRAAGADACLQKTSRSSALLHRIEELLAARPRTGDCPVIDQARLDEATGSDKALQQEISADFLESLRDQLRILNDAVEKEDAPSMLRELHGLRSAALNIGFVEIGTIAALIENDIQSGDLKHCRAHLDSLVEARGRLEEQLEPLVATPA